MPLDVAAVLAGLGTALETISGLRVFPFQADNVPVPAAVVDLPESVNYDDTMHRGADRATFPVHVLVGKVSDRMATSQLAAYLAGSGASSIKAAVEADPSLGGAAMSCRVTDASVLDVTMGGVEYLAATFNVDVVA